MQRTKVLILGGLGFIGSNLATNFVDRDFDVTIFDNLDSHSGGSIANINKFYLKKVSIVFHDILDFDRIVEYISTTDIIINCAGSTSHQYSMREPFFDLDVNTRGVLNILEAIKRFNPSAKFIQLCTTTQFGKLNSLPANEMHAERPNDIYSANKGVSEKYTLLYSQAYNLNCTVLRLSNVYGPKACITNKELTFNNYFIGLALRDQPICIYGDGKQKRNLVYIKDVMTAIDLLVTSGVRANDTYLLVSDQHFSIKEIAELIVKESKSGSISQIDWPVSSKAIEVGDQEFDNTKIKNIIDWRPSYSLSQGLRETISFYKAYKDLYY